MSKVWVVKATRGEDPSKGVECFLSFRDPNHINFNRTELDLKYYGGYYCASQDEAIQKAFVAKLNGLMGSWSNVRYVEIEAEE